MKENIKQMEEHYIVQVQSQVQGLVDDLKASLPMQDLEEKRGSTNF